MSASSAWVKARNFGLGGTLVLSLGVGGCFPPPPVLEPEACNVQIVTVGLYADALINPNEAEKPRPVVVRLYQLASDLKMVNARYDDVFLKDKETLGEDVLKLDELEVFPNDLVEVKFERLPEASTLAAVALFHTPVGQAWKTYYEFPPMPNTPEACGAKPKAEEGDKAKKDPAAKVPEAFPRTELFLRERKIDNGGEFDASMFPGARRFRAINLPKASASRDSQQVPAIAAAKVP
ncbi:MAG: type VI secretion system lipoprotein TssJ [Myxococcales bacterium]|nr:type VI secretion system lipoprotein TssJ [Myxococcales bacterium]